jgi:hypothetical protein
MVVGIEFRFAESSRVHPNPFPVPSTSSKAIKSHLRLVGFRIEGAHLFLSLTIVVNKNVIESDLTVSVSTETFVGNDAFSDNCGALVISSDVSVIGKKLNLVLMKSNVETCHGL